MRNKRILISFSSIPFMYGGAESLFESLHRELVKRGFDVDIISLPFQWAPKQELIKNIVMWRLLNIDQIAGKPIDLVIATKFPSYIIKHPNKITWLFHQHRAVYDLYGTPYSDFDSGNEHDRLIREQIIKADNISLSESKIIYTIAKNVSNRLKQYNKISSIPLYHPPKNYEQHFCGDYGDYILSVGRLEGLKRVDLLLSSMRYVDKKVKCIITGKGGLEEYLKNMAHEYGLEHRVKFLGFVNDKELLNLYANCFAVFFAPYDEDYGYITLEAFLSKKPIVTCKDSGGVMEFAEHDINSKVAEIAEPTLLADCINQLFYNRHTCKELGYSGYNRVKDINWDEVIKKLTATL